MAIFSLTDELLFPNPELADEDGLLAIGGDLSEQRILLAYKLGIFPWYSANHPILWWSPDPRMVLFLSKFKRHKSLKKVVESKKFDVKFDTNFDKVIENCGKTSRKSESGTWITDEMKEAYTRLHKQGYCHSVESYFNNQLVGGLYGISLGGVFYGESMFYHKTDASKVALWYLVDFLIKFRFDFIDVQQETSHLRSLGAEPVDRRNFLILLNQSLNKKTLRGNWSNL